MEFEEFLKGHEIKAGFNIMPFIFTKDLGEWAIGKWLEQIKELSKQLSCVSEDVWLTIKEEIEQHSNYENALGCAEALWCNIAEKRGMEYPAVNFRNTCFEIALACLGEEEINERFKRLK